MNFKALEQKYSTQKAIMVKMDEYILELNKNQTSAVNLATMSPESDRTGELSIYHPNVSLIIVNFFFVC